MWEIHGQIAINKTPPEQGVKSPVPYFHDSASEYSALLDTETGVSVAHLVLNFPLGPHVCEYGRLVDQQGLLN